MRNRHPKARKPIARTSYLKRGTTPLSRSRITPKKRKPTAKAREKFAREYGSAARVEWVRRRPCVAASKFCDPRGCENAHTKTGGMGRKGDADTVVPLCRYHHRVLHERGFVLEAHGQWSVDLDACAAETERRWLAHQEAVA